jgi:ribosome-associated protein
MAKRTAEARSTRQKKSIVSEPGGSDGRKLALLIAEAGLDKKALQAEIIDVRGKVDYADYVVIMSGRSDRQVNAIARGIEEKAKESGYRCLGVEGLPSGSWVLMDFSDVIVHIFHEDTRGYYDLESLWIDAARVSVD